METKTEFKVGDRVEVGTYPGIAFYIHKKATSVIPMMDDEDGEIYDYEEVDIPDTWVCIMVGDDREHEVEEEDMTLLDPEDYCCGCGQIGCNAYG